MSNYIQVMTTTGSKEEAETIGRALVTKRLAACVQISGPITSVYWWQDEVETAEEWHCFIKSKQDHYVELEAAIKQIHPYETPEIIATPITLGSRDYLRWIDEETS
jgi:periplasmic divalent cation tolerance protein